MYNNEKLKELMKSKKADNTVIDIIKKNQDEYEKAKKNLDKLTIHMQELERNIEQKMQIKSQTSIFNIKQFSHIVKEIASIKKEYKQKLDEKTYLEEFCKEKIKQNNQIEQEIDSQYTIYQENEIYIKAVEKITEKNIELSVDFYATYVNHINQYMNSVYSIENNTKLVEPNASDLATLLSILQKNSEKQVNENKKKTTRKRSTKKENKEEAPAEEKKTTTRKKVTKKEDKEETPVEEKKTTTRKKATKKEDKEETPVEEKKATTRKKATKTENKEEAPVEEKKTTTRKKVTKTENKEDTSVEEKKTTTKRKTTKNEKKA